MIQRENIITLDAEQATGDEVEKTQSAPQKKPLIATWLSEFEERIARDFRRRYGLDYKMTIAQIIDAADPFPGMQVLDIPTGTGVIARQFVGKIGEKGQIIGIDETRSKLENARLNAQSAKVSLHIEWKAMSLEKLSFENDRFDLITSVMAFHRMHSEKFISEAYRVLKPKGRLLIADELAPETGGNSFILSARKNYYRFIRRDPSEANARFYSTEELVELLRSTGFTKYMFRGLRQRSKHDRIFTLIKAVK